MCPTVGARFGHEGTRSGAGLPLKTIDIARGFYIYGVVAGTTFGVVDKVVPNGAAVALCTSG
jgi:hypothetical protein